VRTDPPETSEVGPQGNREGGPIHRRNLGGGLTDCATAEAVRRKKATIGPGTSSHPDCGRSGWHRRPDQFWPSRTGASSRICRRLFRVGFHLADNRFLIGGDVGNDRSEILDAETSGRPARVLPGSGDRSVIWVLAVSASSNCSTRSIGPARARVVGAGWRTANKGPQQTPLRHHAREFHHLQTKPAPEAREALP